MWEGRMRQSPFSLEGKNIMITGASSGLGESVAIECSESKARLHIAGRNEEKLDQTFNQLNGDNHSKFSFDLASTEDILNFCSELPSLDGLVLCAGITKSIPVKHVSTSLVNEIFQTNIFGSIQIIQTLLKQKKINKNASIVFISSISTTYADKGNSIYSASKGAINSFSRGLALELAVRGITSNCIEPGFISSDLLIAGTITEEQIREEEKRYPLGFGQPTDIANAAIYLLSDASRWMTGSVMRIDGGVTLK
jgi:NAD(P)-dependent dehydrogenase (short-subunit alcohol dehydrogenase family)